MDKFVPKEQYLRVPKNWTILCHQLYAVDALSPDADPSGVGTMNWFEGDLFRAMFANRLIVDLVWYPECDPNGNFILEFIVDSEWEKPLRHYSNTSRLDVLAKLESELHYASTLGLDDYIALPEEPLVVRSSLAPISTLSGFDVKENNLLEDETLNFVSGQVKPLVHFTSKDRLDITISGIVKNNLSSYQLSLFLAGDLTRPIDTIDLFSIDELNNRIDYEKKLYGKWGGGFHYLYHKNKEIKSRCEIKF